MHSILCPVCNSNNYLQLYPVYSGKCVTSDMEALENITIDNRFCRDCGLIFNAAGTRNFAESFYENNYKLMMRNENAAIQNFSGNQPISQAQLTYQILRDMVELPAKGSVLEVGAGKGEFLTHFVKDLPEWNVAAFEPTGAYEVLKKRLPNADVQRCEYKAFQANANSFDVLVALGVLEHVKNPLDMLQWGANLLKEGGIFYIRVPNFANNPNDLFCVDHLSKLTVPTLRNLAQAAGFEVVTVKESGVPVFITLRKAAHVNAVLGSAFSENEAIVNKNTLIAENSMNAAIAAHKNAKENKENFAIFGMGAVGLFAPFFAGFDVADITAYLDENKSLWGSEVHGRPVGGLELITDKKIQHVMLAISPAYIPQVSEKLKSYNAKLYSSL